MIDEFMAMAREFVDAAVADRIIIDGDRMDALILFAGIKYGPRPPLIARELDTIIAFVGIAVDNLDAGGYFGTLTPPSVNAKWPNLFMPPMKSDKEIESLLLDFSLNVLLAQGKITRNENANGEFVYFPVDESQPRPISNNLARVSAKDIREAVKNAPDEFTSVEINDLLGFTSDQQVYCVLRSMELKGDLCVVGKRQGKLQPIKLYRKMVGALESAQTTTIP